MSDFYIDELCFLSCERNQVEMFGVTADETGQESSELLEEFVSLQKELFSALELHYRSGHPLINSENWNGRNLELNIDKGFQKHSTCS